MENSNLLIVLAILFVLMFVNKQKFTNPLQNFTNPLQNITAQLSGGNMPLIGQQNPPNIPLEPRRIRMPDQNWPRVSHHDKIYNVDDYRPYVYEDPTGGNTSGDWRGQDVISDGQVVSRDGAFQRQNHCQHMDNRDGNAIPFRTGVTPPHSSNLV